MIGRKKELKVLSEICDREGSSFTAVYGRRRIGKTYLINYMFKEYRKECLFFNYTGISELPKEIQMANFIDRIYEWFRVKPSEVISDWSAVFRFLKSPQVHSINA